MLTSTAKKFKVFSYCIPCSLVLRITIEHGMWNMQRSNAKLIGITMGWTIEWLLLICFLFTVGGVAAISEKYWFESTEFGPAQFPSGQSAIASPCNYILIWSKHSSHKRNLECQDLIRCSARQARNKDARPWQEHFQLSSETSQSQAKMSFMRDNSMEH